MELKSIDKLLQYGVFTIPDYQRGYSWGEDQLVEFYDDLKDVEHVKEHYAGTITIIKNGEEKIGVKTYSIFDLVDGQQRLTTIHILLSCLHFRLKNIGKGEEDIIKSVFDKGKTFLRLNNKKNQEYFTNLIKNDISDLNKLECENKTQFNLKFAKEHFSKQFERLTSDKKLIQIYSNLISKFKVNIFELQEEAEVGLIFETMNDRGLPLSDIDKIKNYLIYLSHRLNNNDLAKEINRKFGELFKELMKSKTSSNVTKAENLFLKNSYLVYTGETKDLNDIHKKVKMSLIPKKHIYKQTNLFTANQKENFQKEKENKINDINEFTSFLVKSSKEYAKILNCNFNDNSINIGLNRLKLLKKLDTFIPILLAISTNNKKWPLSSHLKTIIDLLEVYAVRVFFIGNKKANTGISALNDIAFNIRKDTTNFTRVKGDLRKLIANSIQNTDFKKKIIHNEYYGNGNDEIIKYFLYEYELYRAKENSSMNKLPELKEFFYETKGYSIEHIHPQNPLPGDVNVSNIHFLGNLVLTKNNSQLDNKMFQSKKKIYETSNLTSENDIAKFDNWGDKEIIERGRKLAKFGMEKWKI
jgi:uncharacterized protein with ParB-like and HNH nuclease domain